MGEGRPPVVVVEPPLLIPCQRIFIAFQKETAPHCPQVFGNHTGGFAPTAVSGPSRSALMTWATAGLRVGIPIISNSSWRIIYDI